MLKVGLTGGIACGKSVVGAMFVELGCHLVDSDSITHELLEPGQKVHQDVAQTFGAEILDSQGRIDRSMLGAIVFSDSRRREELNALVHPAVAERRNLFLSRVEREDPKGIAIVDAALMIEVGTYHLYDRVIVVTCRPEQQRRRLKEKLGLGDEAIDARIRSQMPLEEKVQFADFVVDNSGSLNQTRHQVESIHRELLRLAL